MSGISGISIGVELGEVVMDSVEIPDTLITGVISGVLVPVVSWDVEESISVFEEGTTTGVGVVSVALVSVLTADSLVSRPLPSGVCCVVVLALVSERIFESCV
jgi:hypothetical protein